MNTKTTLTRAAGATLAASLLALGASAQGFNVDCNDFSGTLPPPTDSYAAAGTAGFWNTVDLNSPSPYPLADKSGAPSGVTLTLTAGLAFDFYFNNNVIAGEDARLLEDFVYGTTPDSAIIDGLADGSYVIYTYAMAPDDKLNFATNVAVVGSPDPLQQVGGALWTGSHQQGVSYARHRVDVVNGSSVQIDLTVGLGTFTTLNGLQVEFAAPPGSAYCFGDGSGAFCACAAFGGAGEGCLTTSGSGASLTGSGLATVGSDTLMLSVSGAPANKPGLFFQGNNQVALPAGEGILCASGGVIRYAVNPTDASGAVSQGGFGVNATVGQTYNYQYWFRDTGNPCGAGGFNFTNGWNQTWN